MKQLVRGGARRRLLLALLAVVGLAVPAAVLAVPSPAHAQSLVWDHVTEGFEGNTASLWHFTNGGVEHNSPNPRTGQNNAALVAPAAQPHPPVGGFASASRQVNLPEQAMCTLRVYVQTPGAQVTLTMADARNFSQTVHQVGNTGNGYTLLNGPQWLPERGREQITVSIVINNRNASQMWIRTDDIAVRCSVNLP